MIRRFPCKRSPFCVCIFRGLVGTFIAFIIRGADSLDIEYIATHLFLLFTLYGIFLFTLLTINVEVSDRNITYRCLGIPVVTIDIKSIKSIKPAEKHEVNMFASANEQLTPYQKRIADSIIKLSAGLPIKPMAEISGREIAEYIKSNNLTDDNVRELRNFWMYCRDRGVYSGGNPFPETKSSKRTRQGAMRGAFVANELSDDQIDESFELIMQHPGGENCAVGLQLWAGLDVKTVVALRWKDVVFHDNADFTTIILLQNDNAGATHIYTRPILPQASRILHMMHEIATENGDIDDVNESFVVSKDNGKPFTADEIVKSTKRFIKNLDKDNRFSTMKGTAVAMSTRIMNNTYRGILIRKCGLTDDTYTFKFLCGESLSTDVNSDHYISFTDKDAQARLFALLKVAGPVQSFKNRMEEIDEGEYVRYRIYPPTTAHTAVLNAKLEFENAESFTIESEHGVTGDLTVRRIDENGKKKRKPRKKKKTDGQNDDEKNS